MSSTSAPAPGEILCPDPSAHDHTKRGPSSAASKAALLVTRDRAGSASASRRSVDNQEPSNYGAQHNLKYAKAQDLPSFPSRGSTSSAAFAAAQLAKDHKMKDLWQPEQSMAGSKAAALAHKDGGNVDLWHPSASAAGNSAAAIAMRNKTLSPEIDRGYTNTGRSDSMLAAAKSASMGRQRAGSTPTPALASYPDAHNSSRNALNAATVSHRTSTRIETRSDGWDSEAMQAARVKNVRMSRDMFGEHPPVQPEVEEAKHQAALRASAVSMAKSMYEQQKRAPTSSDTSSVLGSAGHGAEAAHRRNRSSTSQAELKGEALRYINLQDAAHRLAQERLAKLDQDIDGSKYRDYYGYGDKSPRKSRLSTRRHKRASSEGQYNSDSDDEVQARRIRSQMSQLSTAQKSVTDKQRQDDRARLMAAAEKRVQARMHDMDEQVFLDTGKVSQSMMDEWEKKAQEKAERDKQERDRDAPAGMTHIGGGKYMDKAAIEAIAAARLQSTLDEISVNAERARARDAEVERRKDEAETARMQEKMEERQKREAASEARNQERAQERERRAQAEAARNEEKNREKEQKAEFKRIKEQDKAAAKKERADREALARKEKQDREALAVKERADRKAKEKADKEEAKARAAEQSRKSRDEQRAWIYGMAGGAAVGEEAKAVDDDTAREAKKDAEAREAGADALSDVAQKVREDKANEEIKEQAAVVAGGVALGEVAEKVKQDKKKEEWEEAQSKLAASDTLAKVATNLKHEQSREEKREAETRAAGADALAKLATNLKEDQAIQERQDADAKAAGADALAKLASNVKEDQQKEEWRDAQAKLAGSDALAKVASNLKREQAKEEERTSRDAKKDEAATAAGGAALGEIAEKVRRDREAEQGESQDDSHAKEIAGAGAAAAVLGAGGVAAYEADHDRDTQQATVSRTDTGPAPNTIGPHQTDIANVLDPRVKPDPEKQKEDEPLTFGPHRSDIANILDPRVDSSRPTTADTEQREEPSTTGDEAIAAVGVGAVAGGAAVAVAESDRPKSREQPTKLSKTRQEPEQPKERRGLFSKLSKRLSSRADSDKRQAIPDKRSAEKPIVAEEPGGEAADGAAAAGIGVAPIALAAAGGTDEARGESEFDDVKPHVAEEGSDDEGIDRTKAAEALIGVGAAGGLAAVVGAGIQNETHIEQQPPTLVMGGGIQKETHIDPPRTEEEEAKADVSSLDSTEGEDDRGSLRQYTTAEHSGDYVFATSSDHRPNRPDLERHISTIESSSSTYDDDEDEDDDDGDRYDFEDGAGISRVTADSPDSTKFWKQVHDPETGAAPAEEDERDRSPVSPLEPQEGFATTRVEASQNETKEIPGPAPKTADYQFVIPDERKKSVSNDKEKKGIKGLFSKLTSKPETKLSKPANESGDSTSAKSAVSTISTGKAVTATTATVTTATAIDTSNEGDSGVVAPVTTTSTGIAEKQGLTDGTVADTQRLDDPPDSPSSFTRHDPPGARSRDLDDVSSSGAEEEDVKRGRAGRLARKLGLKSGKTKEREKDEKAAEFAAWRPPPGSGADDNGDDDQFEEAQDHFDESLAPPPAFAGQARHSNDSPVRETRFQEEL